MSDLSASTARGGTQFLRLDSRTILSDSVAVKGSELVRKIRKFGRKKGISAKLVRERGKGSHSTLYYGERLAVIPSLAQELQTGTLHAILGQLGLRLRDLS